MPQIILAERSVQILFGQFVLWILEYFFCASFFDHFAEIHEDDMVSYAECLAQGMCHHHDAIVFLQFSEELFYLFAADRVESRGALIGEEVTWFYGKASGKAEALLLTAAQLGSRSLQSVFHFLPETYCFQVMLYDAVELFSVVDAMNTAAVCHVVVDAHREWAWALRYETYVAAHFRELAAACFEDIIFT